MKIKTSGSGEPLSGAQPGSGREVRRQFRPEQIEQGRIHEAVVVGNAQRDERLVRDFPRETFAQPVSVLLFHAKNHIRPSDVAGGDLDARAVLGPGAAGFVARVFLEQRLGGWRTPLVGRADEEELGFQAKKGRRAAGLAVR
jgi:hypothetical protein